MRFLIDECCPRQFVAALEKLGHDVRHVVDVMAGAADDAIIAFANENDRLIVTLDYDFGDIATRSPIQVPGIVLLSSDIPFAQHAERLVEVVRAEGEELPGCLTLIGKARVRRRKLSYDSDRPIA